jgi:muramoyltetrapeptide carboxypeptidase
VEALRALGFEPVLAENVLSRHGFFAGCDEERLLGFHGLLADESLRAVFFARGGHGILRLLPHIDWDLLLRHPRAYVGYSDLTPLLNLIVLRSGYVAVHGPMVAVDLARGLDHRERQSLLGALAGERPEALPVAGWGGAVEGRLTGGCLSLLNAVLGTTFESRREGGILFWEDVDEPLYRVDRMLTQLELSGRFATVGGMVMGRLRAPEGDEEHGVRVAGLLEEWAHRLSCTVAYGLESGHGAPNMSLPLGLRVRIDPQRGLLSFPTEGERE